MGVIRNVFCVMDVTLCVVDVISFVHFQVQSTL